MIIAFICIVLIFNTMETISIHRPKIVVIGSCNTDMVVKANRLPVPGETILGGTFYMNPGGKGANQAIAAARLGAEVTFISKIGYDLFGLQALEIYRSEKINTDGAAPCTASSACGHVADGTGWYVGHSTLIS